MRFSSKSQVGTILALSFVLLVSLSHVLHAQQPLSNLVLYDSFDERFLDPSRWIPSGACFIGSGLECVREIQEDSLRLAVRNYGATNSNQGSQFELSELHFTNPQNPVPIRSIATQFAIRRTSALGCPTNPEPSHAHALITGRFFNSGSGNANDDVEAFLTFDHFISDPEGVAEAGAFMHWQGQFFGDVSLGTVSVGQKVIAQLSWDQPHHQFVVSWSDVVTGKVTQVFLPYTMADTAPPATTDKQLGVRTFAANCSGTQRTFAYMEATFDKVWIGN